MRIALVIRRLQRAPWPLGGWGAALAAELARLHHDVTILALRGDEEACPSGVRLLSSGFPHEMRLAAEPDLIAWARWVKRARRAERFDLTITLDHGVSAEVALPERGGSVESLAPMKPPTWRALLDPALPLDPQIIHRRALRESPLVATQSHQAQARMAPLAPRPDTRVVPLGPAGAWPTIAPDERSALRTRARAALNIDPDRWVAALVAPVLDASAVAALRGLRNAAHATGAPSTAILITRSALHAWRHAPAPSDSFRTLALGPTRRLDALFAAADLAIAAGAPSAWIDPALVDAIRHALPVVAARAQAGLELLDLGAQGTRPGTLARSDDADSWTNALREMLLPGALAAMSREAAHRAEEVSMTRFATRLDRELRALVGERVEPKTDRTGAAV